MAIEADKIKMGDKYRAANAGLMAGVREAFPGTSAAISGASENIVDSYRKGGVPGAIGATVRNTMVPAIGLADDVMRGAKIALDPAANALKTAVTGDASPIGSAQASPVSPSPSSAPSGPGSPRQGLGAGVSGVTNYENAKVSEVGNGLFRVDETGRSPLFTDNVQRGLAERNLGGGPMTVNLRDGNAAMARANAVRAETIDSLAGGRSGPGGGVIGSGQAPEGSGDRARLIEQLTTRRGNAHGITANQNAQLTGLLNNEADNVVRGQDIAQRGQVGEAANALKAQELKQLEALGLRKDAMEQAKLGFDREQLAAGQGLRNAQTLSYLADAKSKLAPKKGDGSKQLDSIAERMATGEDGKVDPNRFLAARTQLADTMAAGGSLGDVFSADPEQGYSTLGREALPRAQIQAAAEKRAGSQLPTLDISSPNLRDARFSDNVGFWNGLTGTSVIDTTNGAVPLEDIPASQREMVKAYLARRQQEAGAK